MRVGNQPDKMRRRGGGAIVMDPKLERSDPPAQKKGEQSTVRGKKVGFFFCSDSRRD